MPRPGSAAADCPLLTTTSARWSQLGIVRRARTVPKGHRILVMRFDLPAPDHSVMDQARMSDATSVSGGLDRRRRRCSPSCLPSQGTDRGMEDLTK
jgi:hypothetical protein